MPIHINCPGCGTLLQVRDEYAGRVVQCSQCPTQLLVPAVPAQPAPPAASPPAPPTASASQSAGLSELTGKRRRKRTRRRSAPSTQMIVGASLGCFLLLCLLAWAVWAPRDSAETPQQTKKAPVAAPAVVAHESKPPLALPDLIELVRDGVVVVDILDKEGESRGFGSGFVLDSEGLIATNYHVVKYAWGAKVQFRDGTVSEVAGYRAYNPGADLAILQLAQPLPTMKVLKLARPENDPRQGSKVVAIGHPSGFKFTNAQGIVSGVFRTDEMPEVFQYWLDSPGQNVWIQTDAVISGGNSGGPLLNMQGEVIGINTWIAGGTNLGFAAHVRHLAELMSRRFDPPIAIADFRVPEPVLPPWMQPEGSEQEETPDFDVDERVAEVLKEYQRAWEELAVELEREPNAKKRQVLAASKNPVLSFAPKLLKLAREQGKTPVALQSLAMTCAMVRNHLARGFPLNATMGGFLQKATDQLLRDHVDDRGLMRDLPMMLAGVPHDSVCPFLRELIRKSPHDDVKGIACYALVVSLNDKQDSAGGDETEAIALLERIIKEHADVGVEGHRLGDLAEPLLFKKKFLAVGKKAPEIVGRDVNGGEFKLSDYVGKVVVLDFWGDWCPICRALYAEERLLVEKFEGRPFVLLGVNTDTRSRLLQVMSQKKVTWRSWHDGPLAGPIASGWQISAVPTIYVLDDRGVIRFVDSESKPMRGQALERAVEELLKEAEGRQTPKAESK